MLIKSPGVSVVETHVDRWEPYRVYYDNPEFEEAFRCADRI